MNESLTGLAHHLVKAKLLQPLLAQQFQKKSQEIAMPLISYLVKNKILQSNDIFLSCKNHFGLMSFDLDQYETEWIKNSTLSHDFIKQYHAIPLKKVNHSLQLGISDPTDYAVINAAAFHTGFTITPVLVAEDKLAYWIEKIANTHSYQKKLELHLLKELAFEENNVIKENSSSYEEPLISFVNQVIQHALQLRASDIHIEPYESFCRIRYRQDGLLYEVAEIPATLTNRLATRLKVMARLDIAERRLPQDGRFQLQQVDIRINTCPVLFGEKIVLRILDAKKSTLHMSELGFNEAQKSLFLHAISKPQGLILVTGPTGSGKTVTLYSALNHLNEIAKNISTVEDPIEIQLPGINQVNINPKINLHFATALRTFLRQDPDIIMVGEIRDSETAEIAIQAAHTGHLVLSTLHTNNAIEAIMRLQSMGVAEYNMDSAISLIIAQRLVRKLCPDCKQLDTPGQITLQKILKTPMPSKEIFRAQGCDNCLQGYQGRIGIYEFLPIDHQTFQKIITHACTSTTEFNYPTLLEAGIEKVMAGITSLSEILRVIST